MLSYATDLVPETAVLGGLEQEGLAAHAGLKDVFGSALLDVQYGDVPHGAKPFGEGLPREIWKIAEDFGGDTYRLAYTIVLAGAVYVLDSLKKKSRSGIATPRLDKERVRMRVRMAKQHHLEHSS